MPVEPAFDLAAAHRHFAASCFNAAWVLMDKAERTPDEERMMVALNQASLFHWRNRPDCRPENLSIGYWQAARIATLLGHGFEALRAARICLEVSESLEPFHAGYAHEAMARAAALAFDSELAATHLARARALAAQVEDPDDRALLEADLNTATVRPPLRQIGGVVIRPTHRLSCHCGAVVLELDLPDGIVRPRRCDCSLCRRRGTIVASVRCDDLRVAQGAESLGLYQFNTRTAKHHFCVHCGIYTHHQRRSNPSEYGYNVGCLEGVDPFALGPVPTLDGVHHPADRGG
jgi:hypothetical protein